ncbi:arginase family protein, partial [Streptomyces nojiriensis]|uniref:arginase family protein n=1 Tax=Streptomyces nojiriensis TaxID=66374 RepID=UPI0035E31B4D
PYLRDEDVRLFWLRDGDPDLAELHAARISVATVGEIRRRGAGPVARAALDGLHPPDTAGFWVHLDADVLDPGVMPAVDSPDPGGLFPDELAELLAVLVGSPRCAGLNVTIYDPDLDPDGRAGALLADLVAGAFA